MCWVGAFVYKAISKHLVAVYPMQRYVKVHADTVSLRHSHRSCTVMSRTEWLLSWWTVDWAPGTSCMCFAQKSLGPRLWSRPQTDYDLPNIVHCMTSIKFYKNKYENAVVVVHRQCEEWTSSHYPTKRSHTAKYTPSVKSTFAQTRKHGVRGLVIVYIHLEIWQPRLDKHNNVAVQEQVL